MTYKQKRQLINLLFSTLFLFVLLEIGIRVLGETDSDGQFTFQGIRVQPYVLPIAQFEERLAEVERVEAEEGLLRNFIYNDVTGWSPRPDFVGLGGIWESNAEGIRATVSYDNTPADDVLRIAIFGGSFTAGDEVANDETWAVQLENTLQENGIQAEVINFGVNAFGTDQAYLRWQSLGQTYQPDIVIVGFMPENLMRNVNVIRPIYLPQANMLYTKPRFVMQESGELDLINTPPVPQDEIADIMRQFPDHPLAAYEYHYQQTRPWWSYSRFIGVIESIVANINGVRSNQLPEADRPMLFATTDAIVNQFAADVEAADSTFIVVHLPGNLAVVNLEAGRKQVYQSLLDTWADNHIYIDVADTFTTYEADDWMPGGHYSASRNAIVGCVHR